jgi:hypothetical protein
MKLLKILLLASIIENAILACGFFLYNFCSGYHTYYDHGSFWTFPIYPYRDFAFSFMANLSSINIVCALFSILYKKWKGKDFYSGSSS